MTETAHLISKNHVPPGGSWFYTVPETGASFQDRMGLRGLELKVREHYAANKLETPANLVDLIEAHICASMPDGVCEGGPQTNKPRRLDFFSVLQATQLLFRRVLTREQNFYVPLPEASKRAQICTTCPNNLLHICTTCSGLRSIFQNLVANRKTSFDDRLGVCSACGCGLTAKVHIAKQFLPLMPEDAKESVPKNCWAL